MEKLEWTSMRLRINWRSHHTVAAQVARAKDGAWYVAWKATEGWSIGRVNNLVEPVQVEPDHWELAERDDTALVASAWEASLDARIIRRHIAHHLEEDAVGRWSWTCRTCQVGGANEPDPRIAAARARRHWRHELGVAVDLAVQGRG